MFLSYTFIYYRPIVERREFLIQNMTEIKGHIMFSEVKELHVSIFKQFIFVYTYTIIIIYKYKCVYFRPLMNLS